MAVKQEFNENDPPSYTDAVNESLPQQQESSDGQNQTCGTKLRPSPNISFTQKNQSINGQFILDLSDLQENPQSGYDAYFDSHNGRVRVLLETVGTPKFSRPVKVYVRSKNGSAAIRIVSSHVGSFDINVSSHNGSASAFLPKGYCGELVVTSHNGSTKLLPVLLSNAEPRTQELYRIHSQDGKFDTNSKAIVKSHNGSVKAGFTGTTDEEEAGSCNGGNCIIS